MKNKFIIASLSALVAFTACSDVKRTPGKIYMPDMAYSRAYESYADHSNLAEKGINYNSRPALKNPLPSDKNRSSDQR